MIQIMPLAEAQAQLTSVNAAIAEIISGKRITNLVIGSGGFRREYKFYSSEKLITDLKELRMELLEIIASYQQTPSFGPNLTIPLVVSKGGV